MTVKLHRCANQPTRFGPCERVQKALDEQGIASKDMARRIAEGRLTE
jgi:hypothetical protein